MEYAAKQYADGLYGERPENDDKKDSFIDLMRYLPPYWNGIKEMEALQETLGHEAGGLQGDLADLAKQFFVETATWGLERWEKVHGLTVDKSKSYAHRRERIKAKLRGTGTTTKQMIINIASAFAGGEATVIEYPEESRFAVKFVGVKGVPANMQDLTAAIEEIKPAHLAFAFEYTYNYWDAIKTKTWGGVSSFTWDRLKII